MIFDKTGNLDGTKRHDYLPFGEELLATQGGRTTAMGYTAPGYNQVDGVRQKFTQKERDVETGLDYFLARYYSSMQGRFISPDEFTGGPDELFESSPSENPLLYAEPGNPQTLNKYHYVYNNPLRYIDLDGHQGQGLITRIIQSSPVQGVKNAVIGVAKSGANVGIGASNIGNLAIYGDAVVDDGSLAAPQTAPYEPTNAVQEITMHATDVLMLVSGLGSKTGPANVVVAEAKESTLVETAAARGASRQTPKEGIYEFPDTQNPGKTYVGQSGNMPQRLGTHGRTGRLGLGVTPSTSAVGGGKLPREMAEQNRINQLGGTRNVPGSRTSNIRNPVSKRRQDRLKNQ